MKGAIEKEELRGRINKILRDEIGRELLDMTADKIIDMLFSENLPNPQEPPEPRVGQICEFWDEGDRTARCMSVLTYIGDPPGKYMDKTDSWWDHARVCRDPLTLGRTLAPEGAEWIAPYAPGLWGYYNAMPRTRDVGGYNDYEFYGVRGQGGQLMYFPAPTEGCEPIKLWDEEDGTDTKIVGAPPIVRR